MPQHDWARLHPGREALQHAARILEQRPRKDDHELSHLTRCLAAFRAELIEAQCKAVSSPQDRQRLVHLNAIISVVMAMHFPIGNAPWDEFVKAENWLKDLVEDIEA